MFNKIVLLRRYITFFQDTYTNYATEFKNVIIKHKGRELYSFIKGLWKTCNGSIEDVYFKTIKTTFYSVRVEE